MVIITRRNIPPIYDARPGFYTSGGKGKKMNETAIAYRDLGIPGLSYPGEIPPDFAAIKLRKESAKHSDAPTSGDPIVSVFNSKREYTENVDAKTYWRLKANGWRFLGTVDQNPKRDGLFEM